LLRCAVTYPVLFVIDCKTNALVAEVKVSL